jgi:hypothetical protein
MCDGFQSDKFDGESTEVPRNLSISYAHEIVVLEIVALTCKALSNNSIHTRVFEI